MENTSRNEPKHARDVFYFRQRFKNRVFASLVTFFVEESRRTGTTKRDIAKRLKRDPALITRWLSSPGNLTLETISDLLLAMDAESEPGKIVRFSERTLKNYAHPLISKILMDQKVGGNAPPVRISATARVVSPPVSTVSQKATLTVSSHG